MNGPLISTTISNGTILQLIQGDITAETTDAIVNAANENLIHGAGVAGAISRGGGPQIQIESDAWVRKNGPVNHDSPAWTTGGKLPCRYVIHAVGPVWRDPRGTEQGEQEDSKLEAAVSGSLRVADELRLESISFPAISTGIFGFPKERAAKVIIKAICNYFEVTSNSGIKTVRLVLYDNSSLSAFQKAWHDHFHA
ncbi:MAG: macro domain-containing protein [Anaerolineales bacterium]